MATKLEVLIALRDNFTKGWNKTEGEFKRGVKNIKSSWNSLVTLPNLIAGAVPVVITKNLIDASMQMEALESRMKSALPTFGSSGRELNYISQEADRMGINFQRVAGDYAAFAASATRSNITLADTRKVFKNFSETATALKLTPEKVSAVFLALEQMASKGTVQMQELRLQLAQHIPGAFELAAKSMNMTTIQLNEAMKTGKIMSNEFLPKFSETIRKELGGGFDLASRQMQASINRMGNAWFKFRVGMGQMLSGDVKEGIDNVAIAINFLNKHMAALKAAFEVATLPIVVAWNEIQNVGMAVGYLFDAGSSLVAMVLTPIAESFDLISDSAKIAGKQLYLLMHRDFKGAMEAGTEGEPLRARLKRFLETEKNLLAEADGMWQKWGRRADENYQDMADKMARAWMAIQGAGRKGKPGSTEGIEPKMSALAGPEEEDLKHQKKIYEDWLAIRKAAQARDYTETKAIFDRNQEIQKQIADANEFYETARANSMKDGFDKELALLDLKYQKERESFKENRAALVKIDEAYVFDRKKLSEDLHKQQKETAKNTFDVITNSLMGIFEENRKFAGAYKLIAISQIIADTMIAAQAAYKSMVQSFGAYGIPAGIAAAATVTGAGIARSVKVAGQKFGFGTRSYRTNGPAMFMAGENPGGREMVTVRPESSQNVNGPTISEPAGNLIINVRDYTGGLIEQFRQKVRAGGETDRLIRDLLSRGRALGAIA